MWEVWNGWVLAVQFLTRIPISYEADWNPVSSRWALRFYPLVGMLIGLLPALFIWLWTPESYLVQALAILTFLIFISGGLHLDGWMDMFDAVGANVSLEKKWSIMKDPHVGSFGIIALLFLLSWKLLFIYELLTAGISPIFFMFLAAGGRYTALLLLAFTPPAKPEGLAAFWQENMKKKDAFIAAIPFLLLFLLDPDMLYLGLAGALLLFVVAYRSWIRKQFDGVSGDLAGASIEGGELWILLAAWIFISFGMG